MNRNERAALAAGTLAALEAGRYTLPDGRDVLIREAVDRCRERTTLHEPEALHALVHRVRADVSPGRPARVEVVNETTLAGCARLLDEGADRVLALNFASAKNPGGGFLGGSEAQEESLARSSGLYVSLVQAMPYYERHRGQGSPLYTDTMVLSPDCPVFRDDEGTLLERIRLVSFVTSAAPNAGAVADRHPESKPAVIPTLARRAECVLGLAATHGYRQLVLGAWGCGVFRNDPAAVAHVFATLLSDPVWASRFDRVRFSVFDRSPSQAVWYAFDAGLR